MNLNLLYFQTFFRLLFVSTLLYSFFLLHYFYKRLISFTKEVKLSQTYYDFFIFLFLKICILKKVLESLRWNSFNLNSIFSEAMKSGLTMILGKLRLPVYYSCCLKIAVPQNVLTLQPMYSTNVQVLFVNLSILTSVIDCVNSQKQFVVVKFYNVAYFLLILLFFP